MHTKFKTLCMHIFKKEVKKYEQKRNYKDSIFSRTMIYNVCNNFKLSTLSNHCGSHSIRYRVNKIKLLLKIYDRSNKSYKQRMRFEWSRFKFRVKL